MKKFLFLLLFFAPFVINSQDTYAKVSQNLLQNIIDKKIYTNEIESISNSTLDSLVKELKTDKEKIAFWVNIYNAFIQITLSEKPELYENKSAFFSEKRIKIAGELLSFDDIEHGILRKSTAKLSLGYVKKWFRPKWERELRVNTVDWRIHFALNCGAKSCPPVAIYTPKNLDKAFDFMTLAYLKEQTTYESATKTATSSALFSWFRGDFGGINGAKKILFDYKITPQKPENLEFSTYDWTLFLNNFRVLNI